MAQGQVHISDRPIEELPCKGTRLGSFTRIRILLRKEIRTALGNPTGTKLSRGQAESMSDGTTEEMTNSSQTNHNSVAVSHHRTWSVLSGPAVLEAGGLEEEAVTGETFSGLRVGRSLGLMTARMLPLWAQVMARACHPRQEIDLEADSHYLTLLTRAVAWTEKHLQIELGCRWGTQTPGSSQPP
ncbi:unnamed protein product, partial [Allacma fusca]